MNPFIALRQIYLHFHKHGLTGFYLQAQRLLPHRPVKQSTVTHSSPRQILCAFEGNGFELLTLLSWNHLSQSLSCIPTRPREKLTRVLEHSTLYTHGDWEGHSCSLVPTDPRSPLFPHQLVSTAGPRYGQPSMPSFTSFLQ